jgi:ketosteroid isomerase-like protein
MEGIMKSITLFLLIAILPSFGCAPPASESTAEISTIDLDSERDALMAVDKALFESHDDIEAFLSYIADGAHLMPFGAPLAQGDTIRATWEGLISMPGFGLEWEATGAEVAASGDIGYTIGTFKLTAEQDGTAMLTEGKYVTVWHKQADGSWKLQVDSFNTNGPPTAVED